MVHMTIIHKKRPLSGGHFITKHVKIIEGYLLLLF